MFCTKTCQGNKSQIELPPEGVVFPLAPWLSASPCPSLVPSLVPSPSLWPAPCQPGLKKKQLSCRCLARGTVLAPPALSLSLSLTRAVQTCGPSCVWHRSLRQASGVSKCLKWTHSTGAGCVNRSVSKSPRNRFLQPISKVHSECPSRSGSICDYHGRERCKSQATQGASKSS